MKSEDSRNSLVEMLYNIQRHIREALYRGDFNYDTATRTLQQHLQTASEIEDNLLRARTLVLMATIDAERNVFDRAEELFLEASTAYDAAGLRAGAGVMFNNLGEVMRRQGNIEAASAYYQQAVPILEEHGGPSTMINLYSNQGLLWVGAKQPQKAISFFEEALRQVDEFVAAPRDVLDMISETLNGMAIAHLQLGELGTATEYAERALEQAIEVATIDQMAGAYQTLAEITIVSEASPEVTMELLEKSEQQWRRFHSNVQLGDFLLIKGDFFVERGDTEQALLAYEEALACFTEVDVTNKVETAQQRLHTLRE
jgi:tetratricopeptide (TPR) repeat protein